MDFLSRKEQLFQSCREGLAEFDFSAAYTTLLDEHLRELFGRALKEFGRPDGLALLALGGYGRGEMSPYSDVDILFLHDRGILDEDIQPHLESILYPLWDQKLDLGQSSRTVEECQQLGRTDFVTLVSLLESRLLAGDESLYAALRQWLGYFLSSKPHRRIFLKELKTNIDERHEKHGRSPYLLEPNVKEGQGGLRDIQATFWLGQGLFGFKSLDELVKGDFLPRDSAQGLIKARAFMNRVRACLHILSEGKNDILTFEGQEGVAGMLGYRAQGEISAVERFMQEYYTQVYLITNTLDYCLDRSEEDLRSDFVRRITSRARVVEKGLQVQRGQVEIASSAEVHRRPVLMMRAFDVAMTEGLKLSHRTQDIIRRNLSLVDDDYRRNPEVAEAFFRALTSTPPGKVSTPKNLVAMKDINFLAAYIPELAPVKALVQNDAYHVYTVDVHQVLTVWQLKKIASGHSRSGDDAFDRDVFNQVNDKRVLYLAAFLHDIGKGLGRDHARRGAEMVIPVGARLGLGLEAVNALSFLVEEHVFLIETATRRDLTEEKLIFNCAQKIGQIDLLNMLYLLTVADARATGPQAWNNWRASLLRDLYTKIHHVLARSNLAGKEEADKRDKIKQEVKQRLGGRLEMKEIDRLLEDASAQYYSVMDAGQVARHLLLEADLQNNLMVWDVRAGSEDFYEITILTADRPGLLADLAGVFSLNNINILGAQVFTRSRGIAIDVFHVEPPVDDLMPERIWEKAKTDLHNVLAGELVVSESLPFKKPVFKKAGKSPRRPSRVLVDNDTSDFCSIIEVYTHDRLGLLYDLTRTLFDLGLTIYLAKISTKVDQVVDVFYVRDLDGQKIDNPDRVKFLEETLKAKLR